MAKVLMQRWIGRTALVTGASAGIGREITKELLRQGLNVVACARRAELLETIPAEVTDPHGNFLAVKCDVGKEEDILAMFAQIKASPMKGVDICVNNAGFGDRFLLSEGSTDVWRRMLEVNVLGLSICTREALQSMKERDVDDGHIVHIASIVAHTVVASVPFYSATKFAVKALAEGLRQELQSRKSGIRVSMVSPGLVRTEFAEVIGTKERAEAFYDANSYLRAEDCSAAVMHVLSAPPHVQTHDVIVYPIAQPRQ